MRSKLAILLLCLHAFGLVLASTSFTAVSWIFGNRSWSFTYFQYCYSDGWGRPYQSDYALAVVIAYLAAFSLGIAAYVLAQGIARTGWVALGAILCFVGLISFLIEGSHWLWEHHLSWIATCPLASMVLAAVVGRQLWKANRKWAQPGAAPGGVPEPSPDRNG